MIDKIPTPKDIRVRAQKSPLLYAILMHYEKGTIRWQEALMWAIAELDDENSRLLEQAEKLTKASDVTWNIRSLTQPEIDSLKASIGKTSHLAHIPARKAAEGKG